jgi:DNA repair protein RecN (Recombination protein N)
MLTSLNVRNFALIDHLELTFGDGLNILTGETGAGKSIVIDALGLALGERASADMIRSGTDKLSVEAAFTLDDTPNSTSRHLTENGLDNDDDPHVLILARELSNSGKSQSRINGRLVTTSMLRRIGQDLVDVHGQHEHQSLLSSETHIDLLDNWLGAEVLSLGSAAAEGFKEINTLKRNLETLRSQARERARDQDLYKFQLAEITDANLQIFEEEALLQERSKLENVERLRSVSEEAYSMLNTTATDAITKNLSSLARAADLDIGLSIIVEQLTESSAFLEEAVSQIRRYRDSLEVEPGRLDAVNERLNLIHSLQRKYGSTIEEVISYSEELSSKLLSIEHSDELEEDIQFKLQKIAKSFQGLVDELSERRLAGGKQFSAAIVAELVDLGMSQTSFVVSVAEQAASAKGKDKIEFMLSTNPGEPLRPLARIASGGETSRLMLAIKSVLARSSYVPTMIFDEIDTGIGGRTGRIIADKLASLSKIAQILCITHLPQIASRPAAAHFSIEKFVTGGRTNVSVVALSPMERETEIARMLGGDSSQTVLQHAREMLSAK